MSYIIIEKKTSGKDDFWQCDSLQEFIQIHEREDNYSYDIYTKEQALETYDECYHETINELGENIIIAGEEFYDQNDPQAPTKLQYTIDYCKSGLLDFKIFEVYENI